MKSKFCVGLALSLVSVLALAACGGGEKASSDSAAGSAGHSAGEAAHAAADPHGHGGPNTSHDEVQRGPIPRTIASMDEEKHLGELTMLTDGGENAEAYFSFDGTQLVYQTTDNPQGCDQIFTMGLDASNRTMVSTGKGRTTCAYFLPGDDKIVYSSTHADDDACPPQADMSQGYVWALYPSYDVYVANADGSDPQPLTTTPGYDAEATVSPSGDRIVFTSVRDGDLEIYTMNLDGSDVRRLTNEVGYDGGPFYSPDGSKIVYRSHHPKDPDAIADYQRLLAQGLIRPGRLEVFVMDADGSNKRQVTHLDAATFGPFFHPSGEKVVFSTNYPDKGREFDLYMINLDGTGLERITYSEGFDGFPMWSPDGKTFVFASNRHNSREGETNVFVTQWKD